MRNSRVKIHDPNASLPYGIDWTDFLGATDTVVGSTWTVNRTGLILGSSSFTDTTTQVYVSGGTAQVNYLLTNHVVTEQGLYEDRSLIIKVRNR